MFLPVDQNIIFLSIANLKYFRTHNYIIIIQLFIYIWFILFTTICIYTATLFIVNIQIIIDWYIGDCMYNII